MPIIWCWATLNSLYTRNSGGNSLLNWREQQQQQQQTTKKTTTRQRTTSNNASASNAVAGSISETLRTPPTFAVGSLKRAVACSQALLLAYAATRRLNVVVFARPVQWIFVSATTEHVIAEYASLVQPLYSGVPSQLDWLDEQGYGHVMEFLH